MIRGGKILFVGASLVSAGCVMDHEVRVRPIADPAAKFRFGGGLLAEGRAQLAFGNAGLALETFRRLQRQQPESPDAFSGIAACYAAMGRYDLARANYEFALAYAPSDARLLTALASSLDRLGENEQAIEVRAEAARLTAAIVETHAVQTAVAPLAAPRLATVTVKIPAPSGPFKKVTREIAKSDFGPLEVDLPPARPAQLAMPNLAANAAVRNLALLETPPVATGPAAVRTATAVMKTRETGLSIAGIAESHASQNAAERPAVPRLASATIKAPIPVEIARADVGPLKVNLSAARPPVLAVTSLPAKLEIPILPLLEMPSVVNAAVPVQTPTPVDKRRVQVAEVAIRSEVGPRLERLSTGEVSLVTMPKAVSTARAVSPQAKPDAGSRTARAVAVLNLAQARAAGRDAVASAVRWVPLRYATAPGNIQILNAARSHKLAARTRVALLDHGWRKIGIGNALHVRQHSVVLYSPERAGVARRIAAHFHCKAVKVRGAVSVLVLLGRDAVSSKRSTSPA